MDEGRRRLAWPRRREALAESGWSEATLGASINSDGADSGKARHRGRASVLAEHVEVAPVREVAEREARGGVRPGDLSRRSVVAEGAWGDRAAHPADVAPAVVTGHDQPAGAVGGVAEQRVGKGVAH